MDQLTRDFADAGIDVNNVNLVSNDISLDFIWLASRLSREIGLLVNTDESVNSIDSLDNLSDWKVEMSSFLSELKCPHHFLYQGEISQRLQSVNHRLILLRFLLDEVLCARMSKFRSQSATVTSSTASHLSQMVKALGLNTPPAKLTPVDFFNKIMNIVKQYPEPARTKLIGNPLFHGANLSESQWETLSKVAMDLEREYAVRRTMLVTRLSATLQSFAWSDRLSDKKMTKDVADAICLSQFNTKAFSNINVSDMLAARDDLCIFPKVSSVAPEARSARDNLTKTKIGPVPDRGGRPSEMAAPPPEMPSWQQRSGQPHASGRGGGYRGGGGGGGGRGRGDGHERGGGRGGHYQQQQDRGGYHEKGGHQDRGGYQERGNYQDRGEYQNQGGYQDDSGHGGQHGRRGGGGGRGSSDNRNRHRGVQGGGWKKQY